MALLRQPMGFRRHRLLPKNASGNPEELEREPSKAFTRAHLPQSVLGGVVVVGVAG